MNDSEHKTETLNLRVAPSLKAALQAAAKRESRSMANMIEFLVVSYCRQNDLMPSEEKFIEALRKN
jgi:hypothetical protein